ncbi:DUF3052 family protein [Larkinella terrae]
MGLKAGFRALFINAPAEAVDAIELPDLTIETNLTGKFDYLHIFAIKQTELYEKLPTLKNHLKTGGMLWVSWPKAGQKGTDLTLTKVIEIGYDCGLVESKSIRIDDTWSALKFTHPKEGKAYHNSYGKLKD